jgi:glycosyltransferase involved in cell wall biosynthesis
VKLRDAKIAIVCDWLTTPGGAERVIETFHEIFPDAPIYTSMYKKENFPNLKNAKVITSFLQKIPGAKNHHQLFLPWMPLVFEHFNLDEYDIVISSSHSCAKGIITKPSTIHVSYCHSPMRYAWDNYHDYIREYRMNSIIKKWGEKKLHKIRIWDKIAADRVDHFLTNSQYVQARIKKYYRRSAEVIFPGIETKKYIMAEKKLPSVDGIRHEKQEQKDKNIHEKNNYYLAIGRLTTYKKFDLIIDAFNDLGLPLKIAGRGIEEENLKKRAGKNIEFLGYVPEENLPKLYAGAQALIFPQCEDFGITPLEAMASGVPVIAYAQGGALETIKENETGIFFHHQTAPALIDAVARFEKEKKNFSSEKIRSHAEKFSNERFKKELIQYLEKTLSLS